MTRILLTILVGVALFLSIGCKKEPLPWTGGIDVWAEEDYGYATYFPDSSWSANAEMTYSLIRPEKEYAQVVLNRNNEYGERREVLAFIIPEPRLDCYTLGSPYSPDGAYIALSTAIFHTLVADGDAITESFHTSDKSFPSKICFTGISPDRTRFQGTFQVSLRHDTLGPPIYLGLRPEAFKLIDGRFQVSLYK